MDILPAIFRAIPLGPEVKPYFVLGPVIAVALGIVITALTAPRQPPEVE